MPSASLQSRIQAFEALSSSSPSTTMPTTAFPPSPSTPTAIPDPRASSPNLLESPISPTASAFPPIAPFAAPTSSSRSPSPSSPSGNIIHKTSLIDLKDWIIADSPVERPSTLRHTLNPGTGKLNSIRESSRTPPPPRKFIPSDNAPKASTPLINFESPPRSRPPLPPRKPPQLAADRAQTQRSTSAGSENGAALRPPGRSESLTIEHIYPPGAHKFGAARHAPASSISSFHSVSLSSDASNAGVPGPEIGSKPPSFIFDVDTSSITDIDTASIAESFENVSASAISPSTIIPYDWEQAMGKQKTSPKLEPPLLPQRLTTNAPPALPPKPLGRSASASSSSTTTGSKTRRPPPPPPPPPLYQSRSRPCSSRASVVSTSASTSDRSSVISHATTTSLTSISTRNSAQLGGTIKPPSLVRPTPVHPAAQARYESLFNMAVQGRRKAEKKHKTKLGSPPPLAAKKIRQAAGWRGLSVDLITTPEQHPVEATEKAPNESDNEDEEMAPVGHEEKLRGRIVKYIWCTSRLDRKKLRNIWDDCDPQSTGFVDRVAFVKGMWRIDEELRRAQLVRRTSALSAASSQRMPHRPLPPPRPQGSPRLLI